MPHGKLVTFNLKNSLPALRSVSLETVSVFASHNIYINFWPYHNKANRINFGPQREERQEQ